MKADEFARRTVESLIRAITPEMWGQTELDRADFVMELRQLWLSKIPAERPGPPPLKYLVDPSHDSLLGEPPRSRRGAVEVRPVGPPAAFLADFEAEAEAAVSSNAS
eukprot:RCo032498